MQKETWHILMVDDDEEDYIITRDMLLDVPRTRFVVEWVSTYRAGLEALCQGTYEAAFVDYDLRKGSGLDLIREAIRNGCKVPFIVLTGQGSYEVDVEAMQAGASDYLSKREITPALLERTLRYAISARQAETARERSRERLSQLIRISEMVMASRTVDDLMQTIANAARALTGSSICITGHNTADEHFVVGAISQENNNHNAASTSSSLAHIKDMFNGEGGKAYLDRLLKTSHVRLSEKELRSSSLWKHLPQGHMILRGLLATRLSGANDRPAGLIMVSNKTDGEYNEEDEGVLSQLTALASLGLRQIEAREAAEQAAGDARHSEARYRQLLETTYEGIWTFDSNSRTDFINERGASILGYSVEEILEKPLYEFTFPEEVMSLREAFHQRAQGKSDYREWRMKAKDGSEVWILTSSTPMYDEDGHYSGSLAMFTDNTLRRKAEIELAAAYLALRESEERFSVALANVPISVFNQDRNLRYTWIHSPRKEPVLKLALGKSDEETLGERDAANLIALKRKVIATGKGIRDEVQIHDQQNTYVFDLTLEPLCDEHGVIVGLTGAAMDVTELRQLQAQQSEQATRVEVQRRLMQQREMERLQIARDLHDGPLQDLIAVHFSLVDATQVKESVEYREKMKLVQEMIQKNVRELRMFCNELRPPSLAPFGLELAIRSHIETFKERHPEIRFNLRLMPDGKTLSEDTRMTLYRVMQELLNNIAKHSRAEEVSVAMLVNNTQVKLEVKDNGVGFNLPDNWGEILRKGHLGLVGIRERVEAAGGMVDIYTHPGNGTRVEVTVPVNKK